MTPHLDAAIATEQVVELSPLVRRLTVDNPGIMTGPGTNTYLVGRQQVAVIDPGSDDPRHIDAILDACGDRLRWILATHTHPDHSPGAAALAAATGAEVLGNRIDDGDLQDPTFRPVRSFVQDELLRGPGFTLRALLTPGHVANHVCFLLEEEQLLFTGDHLMQGTTVVIVPPFGDMKEYLESLQMLHRYQIAALAPGHGTVIRDPQVEIDRVIRHRLAREAKVLAALHKVGEATLETLTPLVYDDVAPTLHPVARYSLWAHLLKLERDGCAAVQAGRWRSL